MRKWLILLSALSATSASGAPAWTWVDANGTVHFSDRPVEGARQVELSGAQGFTSAARGVAPAPRPTTQPTPRTTTGYRVDILSPADQETLWNVGGTINVQWSVSPEIQPEHRYDVVLDGQRRNLSTPSPSATLTDVFRGSHTLEVLVVNQVGTVVARSAPRTFFVQQTSVLNPNSPIARPRPGGN